MQVRNSQLRSQTKKPSKPPKREEPKSDLMSWTDTIEDITTGARLLSIGQLYRTLSGRREVNNKKNPPLAPAPNVTIDQPFVMVPGWTTTRESFDPLAEKLVEGGRNGGKLYFVSEGEFYYDRECSAQVASEELAQKDGKVFEIVYSDIRLPPHESANEIKRNFKAIKDLTGADKLDVSAYSMGGLATRVYLDRGGQDIDQLMILGTPNRGTVFANWARRMLERDVKWAVSLAGLLPADIPALKWLELEKGNPQLKDLNTRWDDQKSRTNEVRIVGGNGTPSAKEGWIPVTKGDGLVPSSSLAPPGEEAIILKGQHHSHLNNDAKVYDQMRDFFHWKEDQSKQ